MTIDLQRIAQLLEAGLSPQADWASSVKPHTEPFLDAIGREFSKLVSGRQLKVQNRVGAPKVSLQTLHAASCELDDMRLDSAQGKKKWPRLRVLIGSDDKTRKELSRSVIWGVSWFGDEQQSQVVASGFREIKLGDGIPDFVIETRSPGHFGGSRATGYCQVAAAELRHSDPADLVQRIAKDLAVLFDQLARNKEQLLAFISKEMEPGDLVNDEGLRSACELVVRTDAVGPQWDRWMTGLSEVIRWTRAAGETERGAREFQQRLWEDNYIAATGQGTISVDSALDDSGFRRWLAERSMRPLPSDRDEWEPFLTAFYGELKERLEPFVERTPHLKIFRVVAALYPEAMTTVADRGKVKKLAGAMGADDRLHAVSCHVWVSRRLREVLGDPADEPHAIAGRLALPWMLYERYVERTRDPIKPLKPLPAALRRRGLTGIRGLFPGVLSTLKFVQERPTRQALIDFLRAASPEAKDSSLSLTINVLESELGVIQREGGHYVLTDVGRRVVGTQDSIHLADWLLTRVLGIDNAIVELRDHAPISAPDLISVLRKVNPGWTTSFVPQAIINWLRSMGVMQAGEDGRYSLTEAGEKWAARISWQPESLPREPDVIPPDVPVELPQLAAICGAVAGEGHFPAQLVAGLHAGLWSNRRRHFAILTGLSGAGKTLLARAYAGALTAGQPERFLTIPVQPGWYDPGALLGFTNPLRQNSYVRTAFLDLLLAAADDPSHPYIVVLDEMNLSHPEQYMAPLLSAMETGATLKLHAEGDVLDDVPSSVPYPNNLVLIGTVNMDETTLGLSDKVLDRAFVLEFWAVDLDAYPRWGKRGLGADKESNVRELLGGLSAALSPGRLHFGYRVVDDVLDFLARAEEAAEALPFEHAIDSVIYAKILPKLRGEDAPRFRTALEGCHRVLTKFNLPNSLAKVAELRDDLKATGSARFWR